MYRALTNIPTRAVDATARLSRCVVRNCEIYSIGSRICAVQIQRWTSGGLRCAFVNQSIWQRRSYGPRTLGIGLGGGIGPGLGRNRSRSRSPSPSPSDHHIVTQQLLFQKVKELLRGVMVVNGDCISHRRWRHPRPVRRSRCTILRRARVAETRSKPRATRTERSIRSARIRSANPKPWKVVVAQRVCAETPRMLSR